jgi:predicted NUDIX family NTP pyrophosphohydrolase
MTQRKARSAGLLVYRVREGALEVLLAHPGGPFFARKDAGAWSVPKGEIGDGEDARACALREFEEETGSKPSRADAWLDLGSVRQRGGKEVLAWACQGDWPGGPPRSNTFELEWPPKSGKRRTFPEIDRLEFFSLTEARDKLNPAQIAFLDRLAQQLKLSS